MCVSAASLPAASRTATSIVTGVPSKVAPGANGPAVDQSLQAVTAGATCRQRICAGAGGSSPGSSITTGVIRNASQPLPPVLRSRKLGDVVSGVTAVA